MFDGIGKNVFNYEYFDVFKMNTLRIVAKIANSDVQLSLSFGPQESELELDFYQFSITLVEKKKKKKKNCASLHVKNFINNAKIDIASSFLPRLLYRKDRHVKMNAIRRLLRNISPGNTGKPDLFTTKIYSQEDKDQKSIPS